MAERIRKFGGRNRGTLRPDRKEKRQAEALERQNRYEYEVDTGLTTKPHSIHWRDNTPTVQERLRRFQLQ